MKTTYSTQNATYTDNWCAAHAGALEAYHRVHWCWSRDESWIRFMPCIKPDDVNNRQLFPDSLPPALTPETRQRDWWVAYTEAQDPGGFASFGRIAERASMDLESTVRYAVYFTRQKRGELHAGFGLDSSITHFRALNRADMSRHTHEAAVNDEPPFMRRLRDLMQGKF